MLPNSPQPTCIPCRNYVPPTYMLLLAITQRDTFFLFYFNIIWYFPSQGLDSIESPCFTFDSKTRSMTLPYVIVEGNVWSLIPTFLPFQNGFLTLRHSQLRATSYLDPDWRQAGTLRIWPNRNAQFHEIQHNNFIVGLGTNAHSTHVVS